MSATTSQLDRNLKKIYLIELNFFYKSDKIFLFRCYGGFYSLSKIWMIQIYF